MKVLVTGAAGFVGQAVCRRLLAEGIDVAGAVRHSFNLPEGVEPRRIAGIGPESDWTATLAGIDAVVHLAARVHVMRDKDADPLAAFRQVNTEGSLTLARASAKAGIGRFVMMSSVKVNGESTDGRGPFTEADLAAPVDPYGQSKWEAEQGLAGISAATGMTALSLRPPLVYGPGVKGNFAALIKLARLGLPLPLGAVRNRRSLIFVDNLADAVAAALRGPAISGAYLLRDGEDVSTAELIAHLAEGLHRPARLWPVPPSWLGLAGRLSGRSAQVQRLTGSLQVDDSAFRRDFAWTPPVSLAEGLRRTVRA